ELLQGDEKTGIKGADPQDILKEGYFLLSSTPVEYSDTFISFWLWLNGKMESSKVEGYSEYDSDEDEFEDAIITKPMPVGWRTWDWREMIGLIDYFKITDLSFWNTWYEVFRDDVRDNWSIFERQVKIPPMEMKLI